MLEIMHRNPHPMNAYNPFRDMEEMERRFFNDPFFSTPDLATFKTDITDEGDHFLLEADLPGFDKNDIHLEINGDTLSVQAVRHSKVEKKDGNNRVVRMERSYGTYSRQYDITGIDADHITAKYDNGVLKLCLPKKAQLENGGRRLEIE